MKPAGDSPRLALALGALACIVTHLLCVHATPLVWQGDGPHYLSLAEHLAHGQGYTSSILAFPDLMQPPLYPLTVALAIKVGASAIVGASVVCLLGELATMAAIVFLHRELWGVRGRVLAAILAGVHPMIALGSGLVLEPMFLAAIAWALWMAITARDSLPRAIACGALVGAAVMLRPEVLLTAPILGLLILLRGPMRIARAAAMTAAAIACVLPYGLWMRSHLGSFELFGKLRYNRPFAEIARTLPEQPEWTRRTLRTHRIQFALAPDHRDFLLNRAFADASFDPRPYFPHAEGALPAWRAWRHAVVDALSDGLRGFFHPVMLALAAIGFVRGWRSDRWLTIALVALVILHLAPVVIAGDDYDERYLATPALFALVLACGGLAWLAQRGRNVACVAVAVIAMGGIFTTLARAKEMAGGPRNIARTRAVTAEAERVIPAGAHVLSENPRYGYLRGGWHFEMPCFEQPSELSDYIAAHAIDWAILDTRVLTASPCGGTRALADPARWPAGWEQAQALFDPPLRIVRTARR